MYSFWNQFHRFTQGRILLSLLALSLCLRALVPQGYMVDNPTGAIGDLRVVICDGAAGIASFEPSKLENASLQTSPHHHDDDHTNSIHDDHLQSHASCISCGFWSGTSTFVETVAFDAGVVNQHFSENYLILYVSIQPRRLLHQNFQSRAPPLLFSV